ILGIAFVISVVLGILLRIVYNSNSFKNSHIRIKNIILLTIIFPTIAYKELTQHKTEFIREINKNEKLSEDQKRKARKRLSSKSRVLLFVVLNSIRNFKPILDFHVNLLNEHMKNHDEELPLSIKVRVEIKRIDKEDDFYK